MADDPCELDYRMGGEGARLLKTGDLDALHCAAISGRAVSDIIPGVKAAQRFVQLVSDRSRTHRHIR
jgi:hypothetical protein